MPHERDRTELTVRFESFNEQVSDAEVQLVESYLGDLLQAVLLIEDEER